MVAELEEEKMEFLNLSITGMIAEARLKRGKVNALNERMIEEVSDCFRRLAADPDVRAVIFTGDGPFFSFGFDIPEVLNYSKESFSRYIRKFSTLYTDLFTYPKPLVAAVNGHAIAGGCMLTLACDYRIMVSGKAKISLNEITFGASLFAGTIFMLESIVGARNAQTIMYDGAMYSAETALNLGLIDQISSIERLMQDARDVAMRLAEREAAAFRSIKSLLRTPVVEKITAKEEASIQEFVDIWYSERTWSSLQNIRIRS
jgi:enoyl-CoA hydratase/carnithine racemase